MAVGRKSCALAKAILYYAAGCDFFSPIWSYSISLPKKALTIHFPTLLMLRVNRVELPVHGFSPSIWGWFCSNSVPWPVLPQWLTVPNSLHRLLLTGFTTYCSVFIFSGITILHSQLLFFWSPFMLFLILHCLFLMKCQCTAVLLCSQFPTDPYLPYISSTYSFIQQIDKREYWKLRAMGFLIC